MSIRVFGETHEVELPHAAKSLDVAASALNLATDSTRAGEVGPLVVMAAARIIDALERLVSPQLGITLNPYRDPWGDEEHRVSVAIRDTDHAEAVRMAERLVDVAKRLRDGLPVGDEEHVGAVVEPGVEGLLHRSPSVGVSAAATADDGEASVGAAPGAPLPSGGASGAPQGGAL